ncbi:MULTISPECIES: Zn-dependent hydrolase [Fusobacterium]|uniref:Zn-dependent hydrolase n=1 Tax=Fusobacterium animalis TaxID=76859 RepID=A0A2B7YXZ4_9FUSO|nr:MULTISPECIES: Zn-dependent hydrolase [Fusobacterium]EUB42491.1 amidase, hydantoinase/carbamoylase family [Fusobacterium sp. CM1]PGH25467.1 Zn-dependent hydrolase [Fusobacterium animalis]
MKINGNRLLETLKKLGATGREESGALSRVAATDNDKAGRDLFVSWLKETGLNVKVDQMGNIFGVLETEENKDKEPIVIGSHIDSVINAGIYDGCYGVLSGLEVIRTLKENNYKMERPVIVGAFTNEEGIRFQPDMMGSLVFAGGLAVEEALNSKAIENKELTLKNELQRIGYYGNEKPGFFKPYAYLELHVEQGPILDYEKISIGAVENLQGISWQKIIVYGEANHAGTTPIRLRKDAGYVTAKIITFLRDLVNNSNGTTVATIGTISFEPNAINVIPSKSTFTVDLRDPNEEKLKSAEKALKNYLEKLRTEERMKIETERLVRFLPVTFNERIVKIIEEVAKDKNYSCRRMTSGAGHDAQMMSRICPTAMIFVPSYKGISHNPAEFTEDEDLLKGTSVLLDVVTKL